MNKLQWIVIAVLGLLIVVVDFRMFFMSLLADGVLLAVLLGVVWKFTNKKSK